MIEHIQQSIPYLDILVNNAAQTVRKPPEFYRHLIKGESTDLDQDESIQQDYGPRQHSLITQEARERESVILINENDTAAPSALLSQVRLLPDEQDQSLQKYFPKDKYDYFGQQLDLRSENSWILKASRVSPVEMLETQVINNCVPFMFVSQLRSLMEKSPNADRYILNVSATEGTFYRYKTSNHPHTNMAKAALNMLTRTSAVDYQTSGFYMTSIDTGWVTDERPLHFVKNTVVQPPLDELDGAMRVLDPCFQGIKHKKYHYGVLKTIEYLDGNNMNHKKTVS